MKNKERTGKEQGVSSVRHKGILKSNPWVVIARRSGRYFEKLEGDAHLLKGFSFLIQPASSSWLGRGSMKRTSGKAQELKNLKVPTREQKKSHSLGWRDTYTAQVRTGKPREKKISRRQLI